MLRQRGLACIGVLAFLTLLVFGSSNVWAGAPQNINTQLENIETAVQGVQEGVDDVQSTLDVEVVPYIGGGEVRIPIDSLPFTIDAPESYYVTGNLCSTGDGIVVNADNVTIDLMGFSLTGSGTGNGIGGDVLINVEVKNGTVRGFENGVLLAGEHGKGYRAINLRAVSNGRGIWLQGKGNLVKDCTAVLNDSEGIWVTQGIVIGSVCHSNGGDAIKGHRKCLITGNNCHGNGGAGIYLAYESRIAENVLVANGSWGIRANDTCNITENVLKSNYGGVIVRNWCLLKGNNLMGGGSVILVEKSHNSIEENLITYGGKGIYFKGTGNLYMNNRFSGNADDLVDEAGNKDGGGNISF